MGLTVFAIFSTKEHRGGIKIVKTITHADYSHDHYENDSVPIV